MWMSSWISFVNRYFTFFDIPGFKILLALSIILLAFLFRKIFSLWIVKYLKTLTARTKTTLDDELLVVLDPPIRYAIIVAGLFVARIVIGSIDPIADHVFKNFLQFGFVAIISWLIYRSARIFTFFLEQMAQRSGSELIKLLIPYLQKMIRIAAIILVIIKAAELFLGMSVAAFIGLLGGMGLTLGLVFKDIIANWFGCGIIYIDNLFREGDWVQLDDGRLVDGDVERIGLRSTIIRNFDKTVSIVPNSTITTAVVKNWSRMYKRRVKYNFSIDGLGSEQMTRLLDGIRRLLSEDQDVHQEFHMVNFRELEGNSRVIRLYYFTRTLVWAEHEAVRERINMKILQLFETEHIDKLAYTIVDLSDDRPRADQTAELSPAGV